MEWDQIFDQFLSNGYREYPTSLGFEHAHCLLQKRLTDEKGIKYFVSVYAYAPSADSVLTGSFYSDFRTSRGDEHFSFGCTVVSPDHAEKLAAEFWTKFECDYYEVKE